jgi:general secretion pathway protein F
MAVYEYRGILITTGKQTKGVRDAENPKHLRAVLRREGILLTSAAEESQAKTKTRRNIDLFAFVRRAGTADVATMTRQLATLVRAGIPLVESIGALTDQVDKEDLKRILTNIRERLNEGSSFAQALEQHPRVFPSIYVSMVAAGEVSGTLEQVLERLADFLESQARLKGKVGGALAYPVLMLIIGGGLIGVLMTAVVPKVTSIFESMDQVLPWYTQLLIFVSNFLSGYWWVLAPLVGLAIFLFLRWKRAPVGRMKWDTFTLKTPIFGRLQMMLAVARFSRTLATLLSAGVPLLKAMDISHRVLNNARLQSIIVDAAGSIREGESIAEPLKRSGQFPPIVTHMIAVGEKSGQLEQMLESVAQAYDAQVEVRIQTLTSLLEPLIIVFMGSTVGFVAFSILMPLIQMNEFVK